MKSLTILALLVTVCAVFFSVGHTEETTDDFKEAVLEDVHGDTEDESQLTDSFKNRDDDNDDEGDDYDDDDELENAVDSVNETPSNDEDEPEMFKRAPLWGRRRRRRRFFRLPRIRRIRLPRIRLPRIRRIRLPRIRLPRFRRIRLPRIRLPRIRLRLRRVVRRVKDKVKNFKPCLKTICGFVKNSKTFIVKFVCRQVKKLGDEPEYPFLSSDETFIEAHEADELVKQGYVKE